MDYKKMYEEALERAKYLKENTDSVNAKDISYTFEYIFPELSGSEDERIRKAIGYAIGQSAHSDGTLTNGITSKEALAWLEKQGEQKSAWNKEDNKNLNSVEWIIENSENLNEVFETIDSPEYIKKYFIDWLKSLIKPQNRWKPSEQNIKDLEWCADLVKDKMGVGFHRLQVFIDELKNNK